MVDEVTADRAIVEAGGVGYELLASTQTLNRIARGQRVRLYTHLHLAEGVMALYGFYATQERDMFRRLMSVSRVGPKLALAVLSKLTVGDVTAAIVTNNAAAFDRVPGMGRKTAARVLLELREHVEAGQLAPSEQNERGEDVRAEAVAALVQLGYDGLSASRAVTAVEDARTVEEMITRALKKLAK